MTETESEFENEKGHKRFQGTYYPPDKHAKLIEKHAQERNAEEKVRANDRRKLLLKNLSTKDKK